MKKLIYLLMLLPLIVAMKCEKDEPLIEPEPLPPLGSVVGHWIGEWVNVKEFHDGKKVAESTFPLPKPKSAGIFLNEIHLTETHMDFIFSDPEMDAFDLLYYVENRQIFIDHLDGGQVFACNLNSVTDSQLVATFKAEYVDEINSKSVVVYREQRYTYNLKK